MHTLRYYINLIKESELIEPNITKQQVKNLDLDKLEKFQSKHTDDKTTGLYAYARDIDPHQVRLTAYKPDLLTNDPKYQYIQRIKPLMGKNPYVPNVYEIKIIMAKNLETGQVKPSYIMQKLFRTADVPLLSLYAVLDRLMQKCSINRVTGYTGEFITRNTQKVNQLYDQIYYSIMIDQADDPIGNEGEIGSSDMILNFKARTINLIIDYLTFLYDGIIPCTDNNLITVMSIIKKLDAMPNFSYDLHSDNIMFRSSNFGHQLVITDPIAYDKPVESDSDPIDTNYADMYNYN